MSKAELRNVSCISLNTMTKLNRYEPVMLSGVIKICDALDVNYGDIIFYVPDKEGSNQVGIWAKKNLVMGIFSVGIVEIG